MTFEVVVVGSGMSGAHACQTLLERNLSVLLLDVGNRETSFNIPEKNFVDLRENDPNQIDYFLGKHFEGVPDFDAQHALTPPRQYILKDIEKYLPFSSSNFNRMESLSYGGLGNGWGAGAAAYSENEIRKIGLDPTEIQNAYRTIANRIGISGEADDISKFCADTLENVLQPPFKIDESISAVYDRYKKNRSQLNKRGIFVGRMPMAVLTKPLHGRGSIPYTDMEFWADHSEAVYRPWMTLRELEKNPQFTYQSKSLVLKFEEKDSEISLEYLDLSSNEKRTIKCKKLVLAGGAMGTARIVLRSFSSENARLPILTNSYSIAPCVHFPFLGRPLKKEKSSLGQLEFYSVSDDFSAIRMVSLYTYRSLLLFKLIKEMPLGFKAGLILTRYLQSGLVLATINHPDRGSPHKYIEQVKSIHSPTGDQLNVYYENSKSENLEIQNATNKILKALRSLHLYPLKNQFLPPGSTVHYAGTLPISKEEKPFTISKDGRLHRTKNIYVADGSGFNFLPANGLTFTLMANSHNVASKIKI